MSRLTNVNEAFAGKEPKYNTELSQIELVKALSWYSQNRDTKDAQKYAIDYFKKNFKLNIESVIRSQPSTFGFVCRILSNSGTLSDKDKSWFESKVEEVKKQLQSKVVVDDEDPQPKTNVINIQDRIREKASECLGELDGQIDEILESNFTATPSPYSVMHTMDIKAVHVKYILEGIRKIRLTYEEVLTTDDKDLKEGYSNFSKPQIKKIIAWCDQVILDCQKITGESVKSRKPRKRKAKTAEQLTSKIKYLKEFSELKLQSIDPTEIIGKNQLWVYNTKTKKLGVYHSIDAGGLSIKGSTLQNFNETKSVQKKLRKPEVTLPDLMKAGKVALRSYLDDIRAVESALTGRLNTDTILLRTVK
jgi:hypothetical protein